MIQLREDIAWVRDDAGTLTPFDSVRLAASIQAAAAQTGHALILNEYGWLWLNRDGSPTELTKQLYPRLLGPGATAEDRLAMNAYLLGGITEYWRAIGLPYPAAFPDLGVDVFAVKSTVEYLAPARFDDVIEVGCRAARLGRSSIAFELAVWRDAVPITRGEVVYVCADPVARRSLPIPARLRAAIEAYEQPPLEA